MNQDSKNTALLTWIGTIFLGFLPSLIVFFTKKEDEFINAHSKEALNWSITAMIGYFASVLLMIVGIGFILMFAIGISHLIICIRGAMKASEGEEYKAFFSIRLIK